MSFILDALNKAQRERQEQQEPVPQLGTVHESPGQAEQKRPRRWPLVVTMIALLCVAAFLGGRWLSSAEQTAPVDRPASVHREVTEAPPTSGSQEQNSAAVGRPPAGSAATQRRLAPSQSAGQVQSQTQDDTQVQDQGRAQAQPVVDSEVNGLYQSGQDGAANRPSDVAVEGLPGVPQATQQANEVLRESAPVAASQPSSAQQPVNQAQSSPSEPSATAAPAADTLAAREDIPRLQQLSWSTQQSLPSINYSQHEYHSEAGQRRVVINGSSHRAGGQVGQGLVVEEILRDGVVLRYQGQVFKLQALNSWVNF